MTQDDEHVSMPALTIMDRAPLVTVTIAVCMKPRLDWLDGGHHGSLSRCSC